MKGTLADREKVLVDVGTGFYVEKVSGWTRGREREIKPMADEWMIDGDRHLPRLLRSMRIRSRDWISICRSWRRLSRRRIPICGSRRRVSVFCFLVSIRLNTDLFLVLRQKMLSGEGAPAQAAAAG